MALVKIYPYELAKDGNYSYINTEQIHRIDVGKGRAVIWLVNDSEEIILSIEEWQRIEPLLTGEQVAAPTAHALAQRADVLAALDEYAGCLRNQLCDMSSPQGQARAAKVRDEILDMLTSTHTEPADLETMLYTAWKERDEAQDRANNLQVALDIANQKPDIPADFVGEIFKLTDAGKKIDAIKLLRTFIPGLTLKEYNDIVGYIKNRDVKRTIQSTGDAS